MSTLAAPEPGAAAALRVARLGEAHRAQLNALVEADPIVNAIAHARMWATWSLEPDVFGGALYGAFGPAGDLRAAVVTAANLLPIGGGPAEWTVLGRRLAGTGRGCSSLVGRAEAVEAYWRELAPVWGPARAIRSSQPLLVLDRAHAPAGGDPQVRAMRPDDLERYLPAATAMFTEELGVTPGGAASGVSGAYRAYRARMADTIRAGHAFGIVEDGAVVFKADIGVVSGRTAQVQGVWTHPDRRGRGLARAGLAVVLRHALTLAPTVSLYVNDFNVPARRLYARLGMTEVARLATVLF